MNDARRILVFAGFGAAAIGAAGWMTYTNKVSGPIGAIRDDLATAEAGMGVADTVFRRHADANTDLRDLAGRAMGRSAEQVVHRLRVALTTIAQDAEMRGVSATSKAGRARTSPVRSSVPGFSRDDPPDFVTIEGALTATGTPEHAVNALARLTSQRWPMRISDISFRPTRDRTAVTLTVGLETIYFPGLSPDEAPALEPATQERTAWARRVVERLPFAPPKAPPPPPPPPPPSASPPPPPPPPPPPAYEGWAVVGFASGSGGDELWIRDKDSGRDRRLLVGENLGQAVFRGLEGGDAIVEIAGERFRVAPGTPLGDRSRPVAQDSGGQ